MADQGNADKNKGAENPHPAPTGEVEPSVKPAIESRVLPPSKTDVSGESEAKGPRNNVKQPENELKPFEAKTLFWTRVGFIVGIVTLAIAVLTLVVFYRQLKVMQAQLRQAEGDSAVTAKNAQDQIAALQSQADAVNKQMRVSERAWVGPNGIVVWKIKPDEESMWSVVVTNTGKSPALRLYAKYSGRSVPRGAPKDFSYDPPIEGAAHSNTVLQPGMLLYFTSPKHPVISQLQADAIRRGDLIVYIYGEIRYWDIFREEHHTTYCMEMRRDLVTVAPCKEYNSAD